MSEALLRNGARAYEFTALVRELLVRLDAPVRPGEACVPGDERVRFVTNPSLAFPVSDVDAVAWSETGDGGPRAEVCVNFMGLQGTASPLPLHMAHELVMDLPDPEGQRVRDFLDLFNHRMVSFLYRAHEKYSHALRFETGGGDEFTRRVLALGGVDAPEVQAAVGLPLRYLLRGLGVFASPHRSATGLEALVRACFDRVPVSVRCCVPRRVEIPPDQRLYLAPPRDTRPGAGGMMGGLGRDTCIGTTRVDASAAFRVELGPVGEERFRSFLPGEEGYDALVHLTRAYVHEPHDFDLELHLHSAERPALRLTPDAGQRLGQTTWISPTDARDGVTRLRAPVAYANATPHSAARAA